MNLISNCHDSVSELTNIPLWESAYVGAGLARDSITSVHLTDRGACIAGKPGSHKSRLPH